MRGLLAASARVPMTGDGDDGDAGAGDAGAGDALPHCGARKIAPLARGGG